GSGGAHPQRAEERGATSVPSANSSSPTAKKQKLDKERSGKTGVAAVYLRQRLPSLRYLRQPEAEKGFQLPLRRGGNRLKRPGRIGAYADPNRLGRHRPLAPLDSGPGCCRCGFRFHVPFLPARELNSAATTPART